MSINSTRASGADQPPSIHGTFAERARRWPLRVGLIALLGIGVAAPMVAADPASAPTNPRAATAYTTPKATPAKAVADPGPSAADVQRLNEAIFTAKVDENRWIAVTNENTLVKAQAEIARQAEAAKVAAAAKAAQRAQAAAAPSGRCGGNLPPCFVMNRESGGNIRAQNPSSSASGKWQFIDSTWAGFGGYARAYLAPESVQDAKAAQMWAGGAGCSHWSAC